VPPTPLPDLLDELLRTYGPCGGEAAVRDVVRWELELPTLSTHGYEVLHTGTVDRTARLLAAFLARPLPVSG
jgi:putative aminopeptidase FrvX